MKTALIGTHLYFSLSQRRCSSAKSALSPLRRSVLSMRSVKPRAWQLLAALEGLKPRAGVLLRGVEGALPSPRQGNAYRRSPP